MLLKLSNSPSLFIFFFFQFQSRFFQHPYEVTWIFLFMLIPHLWDYQKLPDLPCFADGTMWESEPIVGNFHFLTLKNGHLCPDPYFFFLNKVFYIVLWWNFTRQIVLSPENLSQQLHRPLKVIKFWFFDVFESSQPWVLLWSHEFFSEIQ